MDATQDSNIANFIWSVADDVLRVNPSGGEWLGEVPKHRDIAPLQRIFKENARPRGGVQQLSLSQRDGVIPTSAIQEHSRRSSTKDGNLESTAEETDE